MCNPDFTRCSTLGDGVIEITDVPTKQLVGDLTVTPFDTVLSGMGQDKTTGLGCALGYGRIDGIMGSLEIFDPMQFKVVSGVIRLPVVIPESCTWTPDGLYMYITADDDGKQLVKLDTKTWSVVQTWALDPGSVAGNVIATGTEKDGTDKVFILTLDPSHEFHASVMEHGGAVHTLDLGAGIAIKSLNGGPTGRIYVSAQKTRAAGGYIPMVYGLDPVSEQVVRTVNDQPTYLAWPTNWDEEGAYESFSTGGLRVLNIYSGQHIDPFSVTTTAIYGLAAGRQSDGSDLVAVRLENSLDFYQASPVMSYVPLNIGNWDASKGLPPGTIAAIFGSHMANTTQAPGVLPLLTSVSGTQVLINGVAAPLYYVSPGQINFQVPSTIQPNTTATLVVKGPFGSAAPVQFQIPVFAPALLSFPDLRPLVIHISNGSVDEQVNPLGEDISLYGTGFGNFTPNPGDGVAAPYSPLSKLTTNFVVTIGGVQCQLLYAGLAPGFVGLDQLNVRVPAGLPVGSDQPLDIKISVNDVVPNYRNTVTVIPQ